MLNTDLHRLHRSEACDSEVARVRAGEQGFLLLGLVVAIFLILLALSVAAPRVAQELRREREVETVRRGDQYVRAIEVFYRKVGHYPTSIDQLEKTNNIRFLRKRYIDPMTGKDDWRLIHLGEAKTTVKGFFGQPLAGIATSGLGSAAGMASPSGLGAPAGGLGSSAGGIGSAIGTPSSTPGTSTLGVPGLPSSSAGSASSPMSSSGGISSQSATSFTGGGGPVVGVGLVKEGNSITTLNEQTTYPTWEFIYDPRIEQMKAKSSIFGGGMTSTNASSLGSLSDSKSAAGGSNSGANTGTGSQTGSGSTPTPTPMTPAPQ